MEPSFNSQQTEVVSQFRFVEQRELVAAKVLRRLRSCDVLPKTKRPEFDGTGSHASNEWMSNMAKKALKIQNALRQRIRHHVFENGIKYRAAECVAQLKEIHASQVCRGVDYEKTFSKLSEIGLLMNKLWNEIQELKEAQQNLREEMLNAF